MTKCEQCVWRDECPGFDSCEDSMTEREYIEKIRRFHLDELAEELGRHPDDQWYLDEQ